MGKVRLWVSSNIGDVGSMVLLKKMKIDNKILSNMVNTCEAFVASQWCIGILVLVCCRGNSLAAISFAKPG